LGPAAARYRALVDAVLPESDSTLSEASATVDAARVAAAAAGADVADAEARRARIIALTDDADAITALLRESDSARSALEELERSMGIAPSQQTQGGQSQPRGEARTVSSIAADIEDCEIARSAAEKDRDLLRRRKERMDRDLLDAERELAATREEHVRTQAKVERRAELRRELVRFFLGTPADPSTRDIK
jgi:DNA repair protein RAD50